MSRASLKVGEIRNIDSRKAGGYWYAWPRYLPSLVCVARRKRDAEVAALHVVNKFVRGRRPDNRIRWRLISREMFFSSRHPRAVEVARYRRKFNAMARELLRQENNRESTCEGMTSG